MTKSCMRERERERERVRVRERERERYNRDKRYIRERDPNHQYEL